jgi:nucleoside-diphosphate-sugar epimerase
MRVLVTGATGFIGNQVIEELLKYDCEIIATSTNRLKATLFDWFEKVEYIEFKLESFSNEESLFDFFKRPDLVIHLAWQGLPNYNELFHIRQNLFSQFLFMTNLIEGGLKDILITGTCLEYGMQSGALHEGLDTKPTNAYALAKDSLRKFIEVLQTKYDFNFKWVRLFYMYGKGQSKHSLIPLLEKAEHDKEERFKMSGGEQLRDYLPVTEVAANLCKIAFQNKVQGIINCSSGIPISVRKFVEDYIYKHKFQIKPVYGYYSYPDYEPMAFWGDNHKLKSILEQHVL